MKKKPCIQNKRITKEEVLVLKGRNLLPLSLRAINIIGYGTRQVVTLHRVQWLNGETINLNSRLIHLPPSRIPADYYDEVQLKYLVSRAVCVPPTLLMIAFVPAFVASRHCLQFLCKAGLQIDDACMVRVGDFLGKDLQVKAIVHVACTTEFKQVFYDYSADLLRCECCFSDLRIAKRRVLETNEYGTWDWGHENSDEEIREYVGWSGGNNFCEMCFLSRAFVYVHLPDDSPRKQKGMNALGAAARWVEAIEGAGKIESSGGWVEVD